MLFESNISLVVSNFHVVALKLEGSSLGLSWLGGLARSDYKPNACKRNVTRGISRIPERNTGMWSINSHHMLRNIL
jgi:hypothetical protein